LIVESQMAIVITVDASEIRKFPKDVRDLLQENSGRQLQFIRERATQIL
jgi:hypothetical protein